MNKLGIWGIAIAAAFVIGVLTANPVVEAAEGWKGALARHIDDSTAHHELPIVTKTGFMILLSNEPGTFEVRCDSDQFETEGGRTLNINPTPMEVPPAGVSVVTISESTGNSELTEKNIGAEVNVEADIFQGLTTFELSITCVDPGVGILAPG